MNFTKVRIRNFRNYRSLDLEVPEGVLIFHGDNAQGKTNLIEALYLLLRGHSFRPVEAHAFQNDLATEEHDKVSIKAFIENGPLNYEIALQIDGAQKRLLMNSKPSSAVKLAENFPLVLFSPESLSSIKSGPESRRLLLDDLLELEGRSSIKVLRDFKKCLRSRNRILRDFKTGVISRETATQVIESLDGIFFPLATEVALKRTEWLRKLEPEIKRSFNHISGLKNVDISVDYVISGKEALHWSRNQILSAMHQRSLELRNAELESGTSLVGPQKHDINFYLGGRNARFYGSQGQQRALVLAFKMAQIMVHYERYTVYPFLFLDDVLSELDAQKRDRLVEFLREIPSQIFLTTTDVSFTANFGSRKLSVFEVNQGQITG
jgi:DNA replication and repair protein RecF